ncbi:DeoR/GlpR family DNA-binding transcription regulator [Catenovulum agarivorans]|uniref:DeoR/GlpR family DNA-binding transcription regulator n=1 Tax=Catenovulum agarivorans TaxID=1172192 RepID=UPI00030BC73A|nr:DeoR/GlpR family DNA-binding transcription regulator [Catenovulum agarivorans]
MLEIQRQQLLLDILDEKRFATVAELTQMLNSSEATIRRDLVKLDKQNKLVRVHGGAQAMDIGNKGSTMKHIAGDAFWVSKETKADVKRAIAKKAVELCEEGESIIINGGSSTFMMGEFLQRRNLNILTNSFVLAQELAERSMNQISMPGGEVYRKQGIILSAYENDTTQHYSARKMFMGTPGISEFGLTESDALLIRSEQKLRRQAEKLIVLADSSKLEKRSSFIFCPLSDVDVLITDSDAEPTIIEKYQQAGVEVIVVQP